MTLEDAVRVIDDPKTDAKAVAGVAEWLVSINTQDMEGALAVQASYYAYFGALGEAAKATEGLAKTELDETESREFVKLKIDGQSAAAATAIVPSLETVKKARRILLDATLVAGRYRSLMGALGHRKDMLQMIAATRRTERESY